MNLLQTPEQGMMYALYTDRVVYESYSKNSLPSEEEIKKDFPDLLFTQLSPCAGVLTISK